MESTNRDLAVAAILCVLAIIVAMNFDLDGFRLDWHFTRSTF